MGDILIGGGELRGGEYRLDLFHPTVPLEYPAVLDDEGWGPVSSGFLDELLDRLTRMKNVEVLPAGATLDLA